MGKYKLTVGADPEFLVMDKESIVPACRKFGGEKRAPVFISPDGGYLEDGVTVEFNVTPSTSLAETRKKLQNLQLVFVNKYDTYKIAAKTSATFPEDELQKYPEACAIGCSPDMSAYGLRLAPDIKKFGNKRFAGGHIHIGISPWPEGLEKSTFIKFLDLAWLAPMHSYCDGYRWQFYGHPGLYRETDYGVEYRSPDNLWCNSAFLSLIGSDGRSWFTDRINTFDSTLDNFIDLLEYDGHGARLNDDLESIINQSGIKDTMGMLSFAEGPHRIKQYRIWGSELFQYTKHWLSGRNRKIDPKLKSMVEKAAKAS